MSRGAPRFLERLVLAILIGFAVAGGAASLARDAGHATVPSSVASLDDALVAVQRIHPGRVLKVELDEEDEGPAAWVYEVKVLTRAGHVLEVKLDAMSLRVLEVEGDRPRGKDDD